MKINEHERREHIEAPDKDTALAYWSEDHSAEQLVNIRPCGVDIGNCWCVTYRTADTRTAERHDPKQLDADGYTLEVSNA